MHSSYERSNVRMSNKSYEWVYRKLLMHIRVPSTLRLPRNPIGLRGLGDDGDEPIDTTDPTTIDPTTIPDPFPVMTGPIATATGDTGGTGFGPSGLFNAEQMNQIEAGQVPADLTAAQLNALTPYYAPVGTLPSNPTTASLTSAGFTPAQAASLLTTAAQTAIAAYKSTQSPGLIPGTSLVYNPATGQVLNAAGAVVNSGTTTTGSISPIMILLLIGGAALVIASKRS